MTAAVPAGGHCPNGAVAPKRLNSVTGTLDPSGHGRALSVTCWKVTLSAFAVFFDGRNAPSISQDAGRHAHRDRALPLTTLGSTASPA
jgi:hypothetical protein